MKYVKKTLYFDDKTNDILETMPQKKQSAYAREAINFYHQHQQQEKTKKVPAPKPEVRIIA